MRSKAERGKPKVSHPLKHRLSPCGGEGVRERAEQSLSALRLPNEAFAIAVSGGSDSIALMHLAAAWARTHERAAPIVLTVDHGLRKDSKKDAQFVVGAAKNAGLDASVLTWRGAKPDANIESAARDARYRLMGEWCRARGVHVLMVAHSEDDQAETFLIRLMRGSGVDGLAAMRVCAAYPNPTFNDVELVRPLLSLTRKELRGYLEGCGVNWLDDPMNEDSRFDRARIRALWPMLESAGLSRTRIAAAASHLARAREALETRTGEFLTAHTAATPHGMLIDAKALAAAPREIGLRAVAALLQAEGGRTYRPRFDRLERLYEEMASSKPVRRTLHGCRVGPAPKLLRRLGRATLLIEPEKPRKTAAAKGAPQRGPITELVTFNGFLTGSGVSNSLSLSLKRGIALAAGAKRQARGKFS